MDNVESHDVVYLRNKISSGGSWFYWIAGLSLINSAMVLFGGDLSFIVGLGITQVFDAFGSAYGGVFQLIAFGLDALVLGIFVLFGYFASKGSKLAFIVGMVVYALDAAIFLLVGDVLSIGFHLLALYFIFGGLSAAGNLEKLRKMPPAAAAAEPIFIDAGKNP